ncbi:MAG: ABC transporter substrate-binding protein, partial [Chloroflexi bacterium]|nr:ABC transporter substrate-binding protein [Chloroflexota bacterium]
APTAPNAPAPTVSSGPGASATTPPQLVRVPIGYSVLSGDPLPIWVAKEAGLFARHGIEAELTYLGGSTRVVEAIMAGELRLGQIGGSSGLNAALGGADIVMVGSVASVFVQSLFARPEISSVADLRGRTIGVTARGATTDFAAQAVLRRAGMDPLRDATIIQTGGIAETLAAVQSGGAQAGVFPPPQTLRARAAGLRELVNLAAEREPFEQGPLGTTRRYLQENPEVVRGFLRAIVEAIALTKKDEALAKQVLSQYARTDDPQELEETYRIYVHSVVQPVPYVSAEGLQAVLDLIENPRAREVRPEQFMDNSYLQELEASGYIRRLYE